MEAKKPRIETDNDTFDIEGELAKILEYEASVVPIVANEDAGEDELEAEGEDEDDKDDDEDDSELSREKVVFLSRFAIVVQANNDNIPETPYSNDFKNTLAEIVIKAKILESYYEAPNPEMSPPCSLVELCESWGKVKPLVESMTRNLDDEDIALG